MTNKNPIQKTNQIIDRLEQNYPNTGIALKFSNPLELLVATILSAQCTDVKVNQVTESLFKKYRKVVDYAEADIKEFEREIQSTGFYHNKAKNIIGAARKIRNDFSGTVPRTMDELVSLPGVARKTANIVLFIAYDLKEGIAVDTHVRRLSQRLGLSLRNDPNKIEQDLMKLVSRRQWGRVTYLLIEHGRRVCTARKPKCASCFLSDICPSAFKV